MKGETLLAKPDRQISFIILILQPFLEVGYSQIKPYLWKMRKEIVDKCDYIRK